MSRITFDDTIDEYLNEQITRLRQLGIKNVSKPDALRFIIEQNKEANLRIKRTKRNKIRFL